MPITLTYTAGSGHGRHWSGWGGVPSAQSMGSLLHGRVITKFEFEEDEYGQTYATIYFSNHEALVIDTDRSQRCRLTYLKSWKSGQEIPEVLRNLPPARRPAG